MKRILIATIATLAMIGPALAIDFKAKITNLDGSSIQMSDKDPTPLTLGRVCEEALMAPLPQENVTAEEKSRKFWLALKIHDGKDQLTADEIALAKKAVAQAYPSPLIVGRATALLDPASNPK